MESPNLIVSDYLASLKEDGELDHLFPILLRLMGYNIVVTPKDAKGQPQFGKDVIAVKIDADGIRKKFYFELKGHSDKDIDDTVMSKKDGIIESLRAAKLTKFNDSSIPGFNTLPLKVILVHNGVLKSNTRPFFEGFINDEFPENNFERWDIYKLTELFSKYFFNEYLFIDHESVQLLKRTLIFIDVPDYNYSDFIQLVELQLEKITTVKGRPLLKFFASMNILSLLIIRYCTEKNNLEPAKQCLTFLLLRLWKWILSNNYFRRVSIRKAFEKLCGIQFDLLKAYFNKTLPITCKLNGLFSERGGPFETIGFPLRCFEYINYLVYYFEYQKSKFSPDESIYKTINELKESQKEILKLIITNNIGCKRAIFDYHIIAILNVYLFFLRSGNISQSDFDFLNEYLIEIFDNILITHSIHKRYPELHGNVHAMIEFLTSKNRPYNYVDESSLLITILFELSAILHNKSIYDYYSPAFRENIDLQIALSEHDDMELEILLFSKNLQEDLYVETGIILPPLFSEFKAQLKSTLAPKRNYVTDRLGLFHLRLLAHIYYKNEFLPDEWRRYLDVFEEVK
ncbi:hypothetical protein [Pollutibacter soli]|uniref:hypothetical protein n=1 Tax=Pollutibacter soli TaxID=3034157 RepID=UPI0030134818